MALSSGDRIILFLGQPDRGRHVDQGFDQKEISQGCCIGRTHVPRSIKPLVEAGLVTEEKKRVPGKGRLVKRYHLTVEGSSALETIREGLRSVRKSLICPDGLKNTMDPYSVLSLANTYLSGMSMGSILLTQLMSLDDDPVTWESVIELSRSSSISGSMASLPSGWRTIPPPPSPDRWMLSKPDEIRLRDMISSEGIAVVQGPFGSGKRTLTSKVLEGMGMRAIWIARSDGDTPVPLKEIFDAIVIIDDAGPGTYSLISTSCQDMAYDPRGEEWDDELRGLPLVIVYSAGGPLNAPAMKVSPMSLEEFESALSPLCMEPDLVMALHEASGGIPLAVRALSELDPEALSRVLSGTRDEAVFRILLMLKNIEKETKL